MTSRPQQRIFLPHSVSENFHVTLELMQPPPRGFPSHPNPVTEMVPVMIRITEGAWVKRTNEVHIRVIQLEGLPRTTPRLAGPSSNAGKPCCRSALEVFVVFGKLHEVGALTVR